MSIFEALESFHDRALELARHIIFDKRNPLDLHRMALYGSMIEFVGAIDILIKTERRLGIPSLFRSFLEAAVELQNLLQDPNYLKNMNAAHSEQWLRVLREAKAGGNRYLVPLSELDGIDEQIKLHEDQLAHCKAEGHPPLNVFQRFDRAGMTEEYHSLYNFLSCDAHSNIRALVSRHLNIIGNEDFEICYYKDEPLESFLSVADSASALLLQASRDIHKQYKTGKESSIRGMLDELDDIRSSYKHLGSK